MKKYIRITLLGHHRMVGIAKKFFSKYSDDLQNISAYQTNKMIKKTHFT